MISIIIPIYNAEKYIVQCIESVLHQSYQDIELILIDDGSIDNSGQICQKFADLDKRIKLYQTENRGVSAARNLGLRSAQGEYVAFLDSDDFLKDEDSLEQLYKYAIQYGADIVKGDYATFDNTGYWSFPKQKKKYFAWRKLSAIDFIDRILDGEFFLWSLLIKRDIIGDSYFEEGRTYLEDMEFICQIAQSISTAIYIPIRHYVYRKHANAISYNSNPQKISDVFAVMKSLIMYSKCSDIRLSDFYLKKGVSLYLSSLRLIALGGFYINRKKIIEQLAIDNQRHDVLDILHAHGMPIKLMYRISPNTAIVLFRFEDELKTLMYKLSYKIKCIIGIYK